MPEPPDTLYRDSGGDGETELIAREACSLMKETYPHISSAQFQCILRYQSKAVVVSNLDVVSRSMSNANQQRYVLLDRDGVINKAPTNRYFTNVAEISLIDGVRYLNSTFNKNGFSVLVISN